jgi:hypothetical protein
MSRKVQELLSINADLLEEWDRLLNQTTLSPGEPPSDLCERQISLKRRIKTNLSSLRDSFLASTATTPAARKATE